MAPLITDEKELKFSVSNVGKVTLRVFRPQTNADFIATVGTGRQDIAFFGANGGIAESPFYSTKSSLKSFQLGANLHVLNSKDSDVTLVHREEE